MSAGPTSGVWEALLNLLTSLSSVSKKGKGNNSYRAIFDFVPWPLICTGQIASQAGFRVISVWGQAGSPERDHL